MESSAERNNVTVLEDVYTDDHVEALHSGKMPRIPEDLLYPMEKGCFKLIMNQADRIIKTITKKIDLPAEKLTMELLDPHFIAKYKLKYDSLHVSFVQVKVIPENHLLSENVNAGRFGTLRLGDARGISPLGHTLASINPNFFACEWLYFHCFPNLTVPLNDPQVLRALLLLVHHRGSFRPGRRPIRVEYAVRCKLMKQGSDAGVLTESCKGTTEFLQGSRDLLYVNVIRLRHPWEVFQEDELHHKQATSTSPNESPKKLTHN